MGSIDIHAIFFMPFGKFLTVRIFFIYRSKKATNIRTLPELISLSDFFDFHVTLIVYIFGDL